MFFSQFCASCLLLFSFLFLYSSLPFKYLLYERYIFVKIKVKDMGNCDCTKGSSGSCFVSWYVYLNFYALYFVVNLYIIGLKFR